MLNPSYDQLLELVGELTRALGKLRTENEELRRQLPKLQRKCPQRVFGVDCYEADMEKAIDYFGLPHD